MPTPINTTPQQGHIMKQTAIILSIILSLSVVTPALAASPSFARTEEEWAHLRDNRLEWAEIADLVREYNATVLQNEAKYGTDETRTMNAAETKRHLENMADDYEAMALEAEGTTGGAITAASYRMMADQVRSQADESTSDSRIVRLEYDRAEAEIVKNVRELYISYYKQQAENAKNQKNTAFLTRAHASAVNLKNHGMGTELDVLTALEALQNAQAAEVTGTSLLNADYKKLITLCGWKYDAQAEIGALPEYDPAAIAAVDNAVSTEQALANSITVKIDERKLQNARDIYGNGTVAQKAESQLAMDKNAVRSSMNTAYSALLLAKATYDNAAAQVTVQAQSLATAARQLNLGVISQMDYQKAEYAYDEAQSARDIAWYDLILSRIAYDALVSGLA